MNLVLESIRIDLGLTDSQMGLLVGPAFILLYALASLPIGRLVDRYNRVWILAAGMALWSLCTALSGLSLTYPQLLSSRLGVGLGEAALMPCVASILADRFRRDQLGGALGVFSGVSSLGQSVAMILSGVVLRTLSQGRLATNGAWHVMFLFLAAPSLILCPLLVTTVRDPRRRHRADVGAETSGWAQTLRYLWARRRGTLWALLGLAMINAGSAGVPWLPTFFARRYGWNPADLALAQGPMLLILSPMAIFLGGVMTDRLRRQGREDANLRIAISCLYMIIPCAVLTTLVGNAYLSLGLATVNMFFCMVCYGVITPAVPMIAPAPMRGQVVALTVTSGILIGQGLGPVLISSLTQYLFKDPAALQYSMAIVPGAILPLSLLILIGVRKDFRLQATTLRTSQPEIPHRVGLDIALTGSSPSGSQLP